MMDSVFLISRMGGYASNLHGEAGSLVSDYTHPSKPDWITTHSAATGCKCLSPVMNLRSPAKKGKVENEDRLNEGTE